MRLIVPAILLMIILTGCSNESSLSSSPPFSTQETPKPSEISSTSSDETSPISSIPEESAEPPLPEVEDIFPPEPEVPPFIGEIVLRNTGWGMTREQVKASEEMEPAAEFLDKRVGLVYDVELNNVKAELLYSFYQDQLFSGNYLFDTPTNETVIITFDEFKEMLVEKYGKPTIDNKIWLNNHSVFKGDSNYTVTAISIGDLNYLTSWVVGETTIDLLLMGDGSRPQMSISYTDRKLSEEYNKAKKDDAKKNL